MKTDYKNLNNFEAILVSVIVAGFLVMGVILFASLTPSQQTNVTSSFEMFDVHEPVASTVHQTSELAMFVFDIPKEFSEKFYIAFLEVATIPTEDLAFPTEVTQKMYSNVSFALNALADQAQIGYVAQNNFEVARGSLTPMALDGKVLGASIDAINIFDLKILK